MAEKKTYIVVEEDYAEWHSIGNLDDIKYDMLEYMANDDYHSKPNFRIFELGPEINWSFEREPKIEFAFPAKKAS